MKSILKIGLISVLASSCLLANEAKKEESNIIDFNIGAWLVTWDQTSEASKRFGNDALIMNYDIEDSVAVSSKLNINYDFLSTDAEYYSTKASSSDNESIESLSLGVYLFELIPYLNIETRYVGTDFKGKLNTYKVSNDTTSSGTFETNLKIWDFIIYPAN